MAAVERNIAGIIPPLVTALPTGAGTGAIYRLQSDMELYEDYAMGQTPRKIRGPTATPAIVQLLCSTTDYQANHQTYVLSTPLGGSFVDPTQATIGEVEVNGSVLPTGFTYTTGTTGGLPSVTFSQPLRSTDVVRVVAAGTVQGVMGATLDQGALAGLRLSWVDNYTAQVGVGYAYVPSVGGTVQLTAAASVGFGSATAGWNYLYLTAAGTVEYSTTAPDAPYWGVARIKTSDNSRRYLGAILVLATTAIAKFVHVGAQIKFMEQQDASPFRVLSNGGTSGYTNPASFSVSPVIPVGVALLSARFINLSGSGGARFWPTGNKNANNQYGGLLGINANHEAFVDFPVASDRLVNYDTDDSSGAYMDIYGFALER